MIEVTTHEAGFSATRVNLTDLGRVSLGILAQQRQAARGHAAKRFFSMKKKD